MLKKQNAFTLIETIVTVAIAAILIAIILAAVNPTRIKTQTSDTEIKLNVEEIIKALELYFIDNETYPSKDNLVFGENWKKTE